MKLLLRLTPIVILFTFSACADEGPTIDATSQQTLQSSLDAMVAAYPERSTELRRAVSTIGRDALVNAERDVRESLDEVMPNNEEIIRERLDGMTADELITELQRLESRGQ